MLVAFVVLIAGAAGAQTVEKRSLSLDGARRAIAAAQALAAKNGSGGVVAVVDDGGNLMALERLDGTFAAGARVSIGKARTAMLFKKPTCTCAIRTSSTCCMEEPRSSRAVRCSMARPSNRTRSAERRSRAARAAKSRRAT